MKIQTFIPFSAERSARSSDSPADRVQSRTVERDVRRAGPVLVPMTSAKKVRFRSIAEIVSDSDAADDTDCDELTSSFREQKGDVNSSEFSVESSPALGRCIGGAPLSKKRAVSPNLYGDGAIQPPEKRHRTVAPPSVDTVKTSLVSFLQLSQLSIGSPRGGQSPMSLSRSPGLSRSQGLSRSPGPSKRRSSAAATTVQKSSKQLSNESESFTSSADIRAEQNRRSLVNSASLSRNDVNNDSRSISYEKVLVAVNTNPVGVVTTTPLGVSVPVTATPLKSRNRSSDNFSPTFSLTRVGAKSDNFKIQELQMNPPTRRASMIRGSERRSVGATEGTSAAVIQRRELAVSVRST